MEKRREELSESDVEELLKDAAELSKLSSEPLDPELENWVVETDFGRSLKHPLIFMVPLTLPGHANRVYHQKLKELDRATEAEDWETVVWLYERPYRTTALINYVVGVDEDWVPIPLDNRSQKVRDLAAAVWVDSENLEEYAEEWDAMLTNADGLILANEEEREEFAALPEELVIYRGDIEDAGWSWSLDPKIAKFFAHRFGNNMPLLKGKVRKENVIGYFSRRGESEVLVADEYVYEKEIVS